MARNIDSKLFRKVTHNGLAVTVFRDTGLVYFVGDPAKMEAWAYLAKSRSMVKG